VACGLPEPGFLSIVALNPSGGAVGTGDLVARKSASGSVDEAAALSGAVVRAETNVLVQVEIAGDYSASLSCLRATSPWLSVEVAATVGVPTAGAVPVVRRLPARRQASATAR